MRSITRELHLPIDAPAAFALLHTPSAIRAWWSAARVVVAARTGGLWVAAWGPDEDAPDYITAARIVVWDPPHRLRLGQYEYFTRTAEALPFTAHFETEFSVQPQEHESLLRVQQTGFPDDSVADQFFGACQRGWAATFESIHRFVTDSPHRS